MLHLRKHGVSDHNILLEVTASKCARLYRMIRALNGHYINSKYFEKSATHLVTDMIRCSEKFLGACVKGLWVLTPKYIEESYIHGCWLREEKYEYSANDESQACDLISAAKRWRWKVSMFEEQPFTGLQVALMLESNSLAYERLLVYGGAKIYKIPPHINSGTHLQDITYVFMDPCYAKRAKELLEYGLVCLHYKFIVDAIIKEEELDILAYMITADTETCKSLHTDDLPCFIDRKETYIVDIGIGSHIGVEEIRVQNGVLDAVDLMLNKESVPVESIHKKFKQQCGSLKICSFAGNCIKDFPTNHSKCMETETDNHFSSFQNNIRVNKIVKCEMKSKGLLSSESKIGTKILEQLGTCKTNPDLNPSGQLRLSGVQKHKRKNTVVDADETLISKMFCIEKSLGSTTLALQANLSDIIKTDSRHQETSLEINSSSSATLKSMKQTNKKNYEHEQTGGCKSAVVFIHSLKHKKEHQDVVRFNALEQEDFVFFPKKTISKQSETISKQNVEDAAQKGYATTKMTTENSAVCNVQKGLNLSLTGTKHHLRNISFDSDCEKLLATQPKIKKISQNKGRNKKNSKVFQCKSIPVLQVNPHLCILEQKHHVQMVPSVCTLECETQSETSNTPNKNHAAKDNSNCITSDSHHISYRSYEKITDFSSLNDTGSDISRNISLHTKMKVFPDSDSSLEDDNKYTGPNYRHGNTPVSIHADHIVRLDEKSHLQDDTNRSCQQQPVKLLSLNPNNYLCGLPSTKSYPPASTLEQPASYDLQKINSKLNTSLSIKCKSKSSVSQISKKLQENLQKFGFSSGFTKCASIKRKAVKSANLVESCSISKDLRQYRSTKPVSETLKPKCTKRGLAKKTTVFTSLLHTDVSVKESPLWSLISEGKNSYTHLITENLDDHIVVSHGDDYCEKEVNDNHLITKDSSSNFSNHISRNDQSMSVTLETASPNERKHCESTLWKAVNETLLTPSVINTEMFSIKSIKSEVERVPETVQTVAQKKNVPDRSLFKSFSEFISFTSNKNEVACDDIVNTELVDHSALPADTKAFNITECDCTEEMEIPKQLIKKCFPNNVSVSLSNLHDYVDLQTQASFILPYVPDIKKFSRSDSCGNIFCKFLKAEQKLNTDGNFCDKVSGDQVPEILEKFPGEFEREVDSIISLSTPSFVGWPLTFPTYTELCFVKKKPSLPFIYGQWMHSTREMSFSNYSMTYGRPTSEKAPTSLLLSELVKLVQCKEEEIASQAMTYLYSWLSLHPPIISEIVEVYTEAFELTSDSSYLFDIISGITDKSKYNSSTMLLEYVVSMFEINFDSCLKSGNKRILQNCLFVKWLWSHSYAVVRNRNVDHLLQLFEDITSVPLFDLRGCSALCALLNMTCECIRLANILWNQHNPKFVMDSVITLSRDLARIINFASILDSNKSRMVILNMFKPAWLKTLLTSTVLTYYSDYLLSDHILVNKISLNSIVTQFFFLVPHFQPTCRLHSEMEKENLEQNCFQRYVSKNLEVIAKTKVERQILMGEKVNKTNHKGESAVHLACMRNRPAELEKHLAVPGVNVNLRDNCGWTPLHEACHSGSYSCVELLLKYVPKTLIKDDDRQEQKMHKVEVDAVGPSGLTPLHDAVLINRIDICKLLLKYGGQKLLKSKTDYNYTAMDLAQSDEMVEVLSSFSETASELSISISQEFESSVLETDVVTETAPLAQQYRELIGTECIRLASRSSCEELLILLSVLVSSYINILEPLQANGQFDVVLDPKDEDVLVNMNIYLKLLKRHVRKLTSLQDFDYLQFHLEIINFICLEESAKYNGLNAMELFK